MVNNQLRNTRSRLRSSEHEVGVFRPCSFLACVCANLLRFWKTESAVPFSQEGKERKSFIPVHVENMDDFNVRGLLHRL